MVDVTRLLPQLTHVQRQAIVQIGTGTCELHDLDLGSRSDAIRTLKSLFFLVDRIPNSNLTRFSYRLNDDGRKLLDLLGGAVDRVAGHLG